MPLGSIKPHGLRSNFEQSLSLITVHCSMLKCHLKLHQASSVGRKSSEITFQLASAEQTEGLKRNKTVQTVIRKRCRRYVGGPVSMVWVKCICVKVLLKQRTQDTQDNQTFAQLTAAWICKRSLCPTENVRMKRRILQQSPSTVLST